MPRGIIPYRQLLLLLQLVRHQVNRALFCPSSSIMEAQDMIRFLFLRNLQNREHKQVIPAPTGPRTLSKQLYYGSRKCDSPSASCPTV